MSEDTRYQWLSLDADHDLSGNALLVALTPDAVSLVTATYEATPPASAAALPAPPAGFTRYWWRVLLGPGEALDPTEVGSPLTIYGTMADGVEERHPVWAIGDAETNLPTFTDNCWPVDIPDDCLADWNTYDTRIRARAETAAVETLRYLTGKQVGGCPTSINIVRDSCCSGYPTYMTYPVNGIGSRGTGWAPVLLDGLWLNIGCGGGCGHGCALPGCIPLPLNIRVVTGVTIDGDPFTSWINRGSRIYRTDDNAWPTEGVVVTGIPGWRVDGQGAAAAGVLACEYAKAIGSKGKCALPAGVTQIVRAGVTINMVEGLFPGGLTGLREVDVFTARYNPHRLVDSPQVWSPDLAR